MNIRGRSPSSEDMFSVQQLNTPSTNEKSEANDFNAMEPEV
jgi:hypothetical protein